MIIYYLLLSCILSLILVYVIYLTGKNIPAKINYLTVFTPLLLSVFTLIISFSISTPIDTRKVEYTAQSIRHYPEWVETITSKDNVREETHREYYTLVYKTFSGDTSEFEIPKWTYNYFSGLWNKENEIIIEPIGRPVLETSWDKDPNTALVYTKTEAFNNYFKTSLGLYNFYNVSDKIAIKENLFIRERMDVINEDGIMEPRQRLLYGLSIPDSLSRSLSNTSSVDSNFRPLLLIWTGISDPGKIVEHQRSYWQGGKDNEVVFCIGIDEDDKILWSNSFSWATEPLLEKAILRSVLAPGQKLSVEKFIIKLKDSYSKNLWRPRDFNEYRVLKIPFGNFIVMITSILVIIANIIVSISIFKNNKNKIKS